MVMLAGYWFSRLKLFYSMSELLIVKADFLVAKDEDFTILYQLVVWLGDYCTIYY